MANVLASVAQFETEVRAERILAGQAAARAAGQGLGRRQAGPPGAAYRRKGNRHQATLREGKPIAEIARVVGLSRPTVYKALG